MQIIRLLFIAGLLFLTASARAAEITVFAATSLTEALKEIGAGYEAATGDTVRFNFGASNVLVKQIEAGAPADVFFSADEMKMDALQKAGLIETATRRDLLGNSLVVIVPNDSTAISQPADLASTRVTHLSLADPAAVPAGIYAKAYLEKAGLWEGVARKVVPAENVRAAMAVVEAGNAEAGIVYKTDAAISKKVRVVAEISGADAPKIVYPVALIKDTPHPAEARRFLAWLDGRQADAVFRRLGFIIIE